MKGRNLVAKLLDKNISKGQLAGYALANLIGLAIIATAFLCYSDLSAVLTGNGNRKGEAYMIVTRAVSPFGSHNSTLTRHEIESVAAQPWAKRVGEIEQARFRVDGAVAFNGATMTTQMFLEGVPDEFLDTVPLGWKFMPESNEIPIMVSRDYLSLYNFGYAASRGMPAVSEEMIGMIPLQLTISGNGQREVFRARIAGFTNRFNTIAAPSEFISWANKRFGNSVADSAASRLIVETDQPGNPAIEGFLHDNNLETNIDKTGSRLTFFLRALTTLVISVGLIITLLALFILLLSINLMIQKSRSKIKTLALLGYGSVEIAKVYMAMILPVNIFSGILAVWVAIGARTLWMPAVNTFNIPASTPWGTVALTMVLTLIITIIDLLTVYRHINRLYKPEK